MTNIARSRLILASPVNGLSFRSVSSAFLASLDAYAFQELWLIRPGDIIITPRPLPEDFVQFVSRKLHISGESFVCLSPAAHPAESVLSAISRRGMLPQIRELVAKRHDIAIRAFALEPSLVRFSTDCGLPIEGYTQAPTTSLLETVNYLNTKSGFRITAEDLALPVAPGTSGLVGEEVEEAVHRMLSAHHVVIVKFDRGAGASTQFRVGRGDLLDRSEVKQRLRAFIEAHREYGNTFVVEACLPLTSDPSVDVEITEEGPRILYVGAMDCSSGSFQGMKVPAPEISSDHLAALRTAAERLGNYLFGAGYRGFFDIDAGIDTFGNLYLFETNVRRTSTSLCDEILRDTLRFQGQKLGRWEMRAFSLPAGTDITPYLENRTTLSRRGTAGAETLSTWARSSGQTFVVSFTAGCP